ncbi:lipid-binding SYLF domain-containing protein [Campylobacter sputorum]|uniref:lipid-binding SYLF domain-containing protein n=1 Tax=Campylobacter sputorum TaxID=206 RepID=UPI00053C07C4|nr:lipid-binding SYLF domain-containing protein [Campylobacter sputorum]
MLNKLFFLNKILLFLFFITPLFANNELLLNASNSYVLVMKENQNAPIKQLYAQAKAIVIFPKLTKIGFIVGGMGGSGVMVIKNSNEISHIENVKIGGGSLGLQIGYDSSSLVLFILKDSIVNDILNSKFTISSDISVSFGDFGKKYSRISDIKFTNDIYAYANNSGFFAGASFSGAIISLGDKFSYSKDSYAYSSLIKAFLKF